MRRYQVYRVRNGEWVTVGEPWTTADEAYRAAEVCEAVLPSVSVCVRAVEVKGDLDHA